MKAFLDASFTDGSSAVAFPAFATTGAAGGIWGRVSEGVSIATNEAGISKNDRLQVLTGKKGKQVVTDLF